MIYALLVVAILAILIVGIYNSLVKLRNKCKEAWADISTQLKRRCDLIPNLVETVKGYASHEAQTFEKVTKARTKAMEAKDVHEKEEAENMLTGALKTIFALAENYPELKANQNFLDLQKTLNEIEEHIQLSRRYYNATVRDFNTRIEVFPNNIIAKPLGFTKRDFFQATDEEKKVVKVSFKEGEEKPEPPAEEKPAEEKPKPEPPATPKPPAEEKPAEEEPKPEPPATPETPPAEEKPAEEKPKPEPPATPETPPAEEKPAEEEKA